jgi:hypothetical protein
MDATMLIRESCSSEFSIKGTVSFQLLLYLAKHPFTSTSTSTTHQAITESTGSLTKASSAPELLITFLPALSKSFCSPSIKMVSVTAFCMLLVANLASGAAVADFKARRDSKMSFMSKGSLADYHSPNEMNVTKEQTLKLLAPVDLQTTPVVGFTAKPEDGISARVPVLSCLTPRIAADPDDCAALCEFMEGSTDNINMGPLDIQYISTGTCEFGVANLWPCGAVSFPQSQLGPVCRNMLNACVLDGYDGFIEDIGGQNLAFALYGLDSPPAYTPSEC